MIVDPSKIRPLRNVVLLKLVQMPEKTEGGIYIPETTKSNKAVEHKIGTVLAVGPGKVRHIEGMTTEQLIPVGVKVGQICVIDPPYAARVRGHDDLYLMEDDAVLATIAD